MATLDSLAVPAAFALARYNTIVDATVLTDLNTWKSNTELSLNRLSQLDTSTLSISELADLVRVLAPLTAVAPWTSDTTRSVASARLARIPPSSRLITFILTRIVKPLFAPTPHPRLHTSTARVLPRPADVQDTYIEQPWKELPGLDEIIRWCLVNTESSAYETAWPLFLPPVMSFLDDYQVPYKFLGVRLVSNMLARVPSELLLRTGVDALMFTSLTNSLSHLGDRSMPDFISLTVTISLQLIDLTTPSVFSPQSTLLHDESSPTALAQTLSSSQSKSLSNRFLRLSTLLSSSLLGTVIMYTPTFLPPVPTSDLDPDPFVDPEHADIDPINVPELSLPESAPRMQSFNPILIAAAQSLPPVLSALGIGGARFLKGVIPVLIEWLTLPLPIIGAETGNIPGRNESVDAALHLTSLSSLSVLFCTCTSQIGGWSTTIINALGQCWVGCLDIETQKGDAISKDNLCILKKQLRETAVQLAKVHPGAIKEYAILLAFNEVLFEGLVGGI